MRNAHRNIWLMHQIAQAVGDTCIVTGGNRAADEVNWILSVTPHNRNAFFRVIVPGIYGSGRGFDRILIDESFSEADTEENLLWYADSISPRLKPGGEVRFWSMGA